MNSIEKLNGNGFHERFGAYLENFTATNQSNDFEAAIEGEAYERLVRDWESGWDFDCQTGYFGGRGASILIQNKQIDWRDFWKWLVVRTVSAPPGALINFEVHDNIKGETMVGGQMLLRRVVTASGIFEEGIEEAKPQ